MSDWLVGKLKASGFEYCGRLGTLLSDFYPHVVIEIDFSTGILDHILALRSLPTASQTYQEEYAEFLASRAFQIPRSSISFLQSPGWDELYRSLGASWFAEFLSQGALLKPHDYSWIQILGSPIFKPRNRFLQSCSVSNRSSKTPQVGWLATQEFKKRDVVNFSMKQLNFDATAEAVFPKLKLRYRREVEPLLKSASRRFRRLVIDLDHFCGPEDKPASREAVINVAFQCMKIVLPKQLIGSVNYPALRRGIREWVFLGKFDTVSGDYLVKQWKTSGLQWLGGPSNADHQKMAQRVLLQLVLWLYKVLLPRVVRRFFHLVQHAKSPMGCFYYRCDLWQQRHAQVMQSFAQSLSPPNQHDLPNVFSEAARVHLILKSDTESRPVINLAYLKKWLQPAKLVLSQLTRDAPTVLRSPVDFIPRLAKFSREHYGRRFYVVKVDIASCYDSANTEWLYEQLRSKLQDRKFDIHHFWDQRRSCPSYTVVDATTAERASKLPSNVTNSVLDPKPVERVLGNEILERVRLLLGYLPVKVGRNVLRKCKGIPQGSSISNVLCNFFLSTMVNDELKEFLEDPNSVFMQYVDDILFISTNERQAARFQRRMYRGFPQHNLFVREDKTQCNLNGVNLERVLYLGTYFDCSTLQVLPLKPIRFQVQPSHKRVWMRQRLESMISLRYCAVFYAFALHNVPMSDNVVRLLARGVGVSLASRMHYMRVTPPMRRRLFDKMLGKAVRHFIRNGGTNYRLFISSCTTDYRRRSRRYRQ